ncbi:hypothetical protein F511_10861 [Dorcoceras hygrometricum]|uniref:Uncharacterized protein n=1 Tax=Dorcoceras hygrometricum TaxID=472368 RepID=A0A2Z7BTE8_9LAMI|nr:hypothetical protein F511_10861 [Dorcoceras hygrometricum]
MVSMKNPLAAILDSNRFTEKRPPKFAPADISPEELVTLKQWWDDEIKARAVRGELSNERFTAVKELMTSRMRDGTSVHEHGVRMIGLVEKLSGLDIALPHELSG